MGRRRQNMEPFESSTPFTEANSTKHTPYINISGNTGTVVVGDGNPYHPMTASADPDEVHFITHIYVLDENDTVVTMQNLDPTGVDTARITFTLPSAATSLTAYEFCNKHGLYRGPTVTLSSRGSPISFASSRTLTAAATIAVGAFVVAASCS